MEEIGCSLNNNNTSHLDPFSNFKICEPVKIFGFAIELADPDLFGVTTNHNLFPDKVPLQIKSQPMVIDEEQDIWEAEKLLAKRRRGREIQYFVKWKSFPNNDNIWEPTKNTFNKHLIKSFNFSSR